MEVKKKIIPLLLSLKPKGLRPWFPNHYLSLYPNPRLSLKQKVYGIASVKPVPGWTESYL